MSQSDFGTMDPGETSGTELAAILNAWRGALHSMHKGSARPGYAVAGLLWINDAVDPWRLYVFDGAGDVLLGKINTASGAFMPSFGALDGIIYAGGDGSVSAATAAQIVALIGSVAVANAINAATIANGAVSSAEKISDHIVTLAKLARVGTAGQVLYSGGPSADFYLGPPPSSGVTKFNTRSGDVVLGQADIYSALSDFGAGDIYYPLGDNIDTTVSSLYLESLNCRFLVGGTFRFSFKLAGPSSSGTVYARIYKNGSAFGTERNTGSDSGVIYTEDLPVSIGDTIQIFIKGSGQIIISNIFVGILDAACTPISVPLPIGTR